MHPEALIVALGSAVRDKTALRGRVLSDRTRQKMSEAAGRWNKGLTKETDARIAQAAKNQEGRVPWIKGLSASVDGRIARAAQKWKLTVQRNGHWRKGQFVQIEKDTLLKCQLRNGKISIVRAMGATGYSFPIVRRECRRHGLEYFNRKISQTTCLETVSKVLGGLPYLEEWHSPKFTNQRTGRQFRFDGYFPDAQLVVEFHGEQHYKFPNAFMRRESHRARYEYLKELDQLKRALVSADPGLFYLEVLESAPYKDPTYIKDRLVESGVLIQQ